jgi:hypothetical protein
MDSINEIRPPSNVLRDGILTGADQFPGHDLLQYKVNVPNDGHSYFIPPETNAIPVGGAKGGQVILQLPHQAIKTSISAKDLMREDEHFPDTMDNETLAQKLSNGALGRRVQGILADHDERFRRMEEWMAAQVLRGKIEYSYPGLDSFVLDYGKPVTHEVTLAPLAQWNSGTQNVFADADQANKMLSKATNGFGGNLALMGPGVAGLFMNSPGVRSDLAATNVRAGSLDLTGGYQQYGSMRYYGSVYGFDWWSVDQSMTFMGASVPMVRANTVEFIANYQQLNNAFAFAPLPDFDYHTSDAGGSSQVIRTDQRRGSKAWGDPELSSRWIRSATQGAPIIKYPGFVYSLLVA